MPLIESALRGKFIIPEFEDFTAKIDELYEECKSVEGGEVNAVSQGSHETRQRLLLRFKGGGICNQDLPSS